VIAERLCLIIAQSHKATAALMLGGLYAHLSEEQRDVVDAALASGDDYSPHQTAAALLDRIEEGKQAPCT
jgi:hypothetical protein